MRRVFTVIALIALLAPGLWWREMSVPAGQKNIRIEPLSFTAQATSDGNPELTGVWHLTGPQYRHGGYSALVALDSGLLAFSDAGLSLQISVDADGGLAPGELTTVARDLSVPKWDRDIEAATRAPDGTIWLAYEWSHSIARYDQRLAEELRVKPAAMADWPSNSGAEALARLPDGRFVLIGEDTGGITGDTATGLLFEGDPTLDEKPVKFGFRPPDGYSVTDMAALPDGQLLILLRGIDLDLPPSFSTRLVLADSREIGEEVLLGWRSVALPTGGFPAENYEGLAVQTETGSNQATIWMMSDDNFAAYQRTLLLRWRWTLPTREVAAPPVDAAKAQTSRSAPSQKPD